MTNPLKIIGGADDAWKFVRNCLKIECGSKCQNCGVVSTILHIHHINGCGLDNKRENLIVLCPHCHLGITKKSNKKLDNKWSRKIQKAFRKAYGFD